MPIYKITDDDMTTWGDTKWTYGVPVVAEEKGRELCTAQVIHGYRTPELASLLHPVHVFYSNPILHEAKGYIVADDGTKVGCKKLTLIRQVEMPEYSITQKVAFGILCALEISDNADFRAWANRWLTGEDRSSRAAMEGEWAAAEWAARAEDWAAAAEWAAAAAARNSLGGKPLNLQKLAIKAKQY